MNNVLDHSKRHHRFFEEMTRIPHGSYHEKPYSDYLVDFAQSHGFAYVQDPLHNVVIYKPASPGYENHPPIAIQAHMDMVWEKDEGYDHDFEKDPLKLKIEDGFLTAEHTTLGADDGTGVAYILAVLDDPDAKHPPIEAIFTVQEEVGLYGAQGLDPKLVHARRLISLDCGGGDSIYVSSLGGHSADLCTSVTMEPCAGQGWRLTVDGLRGQYSTSYLEGARSAVEICTQILSQLNDSLGIALVSLNGGRDGSKVAADCEAVFVTKTGEEAVKAAFEELAYDWKKELSYGESNCCLTLGEALYTEQMLKQDSDRVLNFFRILPAGVVMINARNPEGIGSAANWTSVRTEQGRVILHVGMRGESNHRLNGLAARVKTISGLLGFAVEGENRFDAWEYDPQSELCAVLKQVFRDTTGMELKLIEVQGGLECGVFRQYGKDMDIITMGPVGEDVHTTKERLDLLSFDMLFPVFVNFLAAM